MIRVWTSQRRAPRRAEVAAGYDALAEGYDLRHGDGRSVARSRVIERPLREAARGATRVLDLGCGTGRVLAELAAPLGVGIDVSAHMLAQARGRGLRVALADAHALPFGDGAFDAIVAAKGVFRYLDYGRAFAECARVLRCGGRLGVHQYAARTWQRHRARVAAPVEGDVTDADRLHVDDLNELYEPAAASGFLQESTHLWRVVRFRPYVIPVPRRPRNRFWNHCTLVFSKR